MHVDTLWHACKYSSNRGVLKIIAWQTGKALAEKHERRVQHFVVLQVTGKSQSLNNGTANDAAQALVSEALKRGTQDNITAVVMLFKWA